MILYKTDWTHDSIKTIEAIRTTEHFVVMAKFNGPGERREKWKSEWARYHRTWEEAHAYLIDYATRQLEGAKQCVKAEAALLQKVLALQQTSPETSTTPQ